MKLSDKLRRELRSLEDAMLEMECHDEAWIVEYSDKCRGWCILRRAIRKIERTEAR